MSTSKKPRLKITVATWFYDDQPGFLDFRYRIEALGRHHDVELLLRSEHFAKEFHAPGIRPLVLATPNAGTKDLIGYCWRVARRIASSPTDAVLLLGAQLSLVSLYPLEPPVALYWNEHPTHTFGGGRRGALSKLASRCMVRLSFCAAGRATLVMPIGRAHYEDLLDHGLSQSRVCLLHMGVDDGFASAGRAERGSPVNGPLRILYTGTVSRERGRDIMLEGVALAKAKGVRCKLTLVGANPSEIDYCTHRAIELGISDDVDVYGRVPGNVVPRFLARADVGVCLWEDRIWWRFNPPTKLFEYLASALPVLASRIRTHTDYVQDGVTGYIFDYTSESFALTLLRLHENRLALPNMAAKAGEAGRDYLWSNIEADFLSALTDLSKRRGAARVSPEHSN